MVENDSVIVAGRRRPRAQQSAVEYNAVTVYSLAAAAVPRAGMRRIYRIFRSIMSHYGFNAFIASRAACQILVLLLDVGGLCM